MLTFFKCKPLWQEGNKSNNLSNRLMNENSRTLSILVRGFPEIMIRISKSVLKALNVK